MHRYIFQTLCFAIVWPFLSGESIANAQSAPETRSAEHDRLDPERLSEIGRMLQQEIDQGRIGGAVAAVAKDGKFVYLRAFGKRDVEADDAMQPDSIFRIASMTKAITSVAVMKLVEDGKLDLHAPLSKHLPEFSEPRVLASLEGDDTTTVSAERSPTIHDLLTHRSGLTYGWFGPEKLDAIYRDKKIPDLFVPINETLADRVSRISEVPLKFQPGSAWEYSLSTDVLGRVIEVVSGQPLDRYIRSEILTPLGMQDTHFYLPKDKEKRLAGLYTIADDQVIQPVTATPVRSGFLKFSSDYCLGDRPFFSGGGGLVSTAEDYVHFLQMLLNGGQLDGVRILSEDTVKRMTQNQIGEMTIPFPGHGDGFGLGFGVLTERGKSDDVASVGTFSWGGIFDTYYWADPKENVIGVLMTQVFPNNHLKNREHFKQLVYDALPPKRPVQLTRSARDDSADGVECYKIETAAATYYLEKVGAGLSSMVDPDGNDWIGFHPAPGSGAAGEYRGFPNAVFKSAGSYFHPRNSGTDPCVTLVEEQSPHRVVISAIASNGKWAGKYTFTKDSCTFTLTKKPDDNSYWVLYEGTPGGEYSDSDWWMTSANASKTPLAENHEGDIPAPEWIAFGDADLDRVLTLHHLEDDQAPDRFYQMEKKMTVFGFGRNGMEKHLRSSPQNFRIQFIESTDHDEVAKKLASQLTNTESGRPTISETDPKRRIMLEQFALTQKGDAKAGKALFHEKSTQCVTCHKVGKVGGEVGPDLSKIGGKFDRPHLIESLLQPSKQIVYGYETNSILTDDGRVYSGFVKEIDETHLTLVDASNKRHRIARDTIESQTVSDTSLMPTGLAQTLSPQQFTDLIAYLESLRSQKAGFGSGVRGPILLPDGFKVTTVATGLSGATAMAIAKDGRIFVCEQGGTLRVIKEGKLLPEPFLTVPVELNWERGLIGVALAPDFPEDPFVYVVYVTDDPYTHHRISRFRAEGDVAAALSETILLRGDDQSQFGGHVPAGHQGGAIHFGPDGTLYVGLGEQTAKTPSQRLDALQGKILRLNADGTIPDDNPFVDQTEGKYQSIWAMGCRNPFTFAIRRSTGEIFINDVGGKYEEINRGAAGANYGWPTVDHGPTDRQGLTGPIHIYPEASISGGDFSDQVTSWPEPFQNKYFFADFVHGWIKTIMPENPSKANLFAEGIRRPVDIRFGPDDSLYVLLRNAWVVDDKFEGGTGSLIQIRYTED